MNLIDQFSTEVARKLAAEQDALIRRCISAKIGDSWTDEMIIPRLRWEIDPRKPEKLLLLDDQPILMLWPPERKDGWDERELARTMEWTVKYLEMP